MRACIVSAITPNDLRIDVYKQDDVYCFSAYTAEMYDRASVILSAGEADALIKELVAARRAQSRYEPSQIIVPTHKEPPMNQLHAHAVVVEQCAAQHAPAPGTLIEQIRRTMTDPARHYAIGTPNDAPEVAYARYAEGQAGWADFVHPYVLGAALIDLCRQTGQPVPDDLYAAVEGKWVKLAELSTLTSTETPAQVQHNAAVAEGNAQASSGGDSSPAETHTSLGSTAEAVAQTVAPSEGSNPAHAVVSQSTSGPLTGLDGNLPAVDFYPPGAGTPGRPAKSQFDTANAPKLPKGPPPRIVRDYNEMAPRLFACTHYEVIGKYNGIPQRLRAWGPLLDLVQTALGSAHPDLTVRELRDYIARSLAAASELGAWEEISAWREYCKQVSEEA